MQVLGIIPARGGSKGVPGKNVRMLEGLPLLAYTATAAHQSSLLAETLLSSDNEAIIAVAKQWKLQVPFVRPVALAQDHSASLEVIQHALLFYENIGQAYDAVCVLQPTCPFRVPGFIDQCIRRFIETGADTLFSSQSVPHKYNPHWVFEETAEGMLKTATGERDVIPRRQELPPAYIRDGSVYVINTKTLLKENKLFGEKVTHLLSDPYWYVNIDTEADMELAAQKARLYIQQYPVVAPT